jgi:hypothetical protein
MDLYDRFDEYLRTMQTDIPMSVLIFQGTNTKNTFLCVPFDYAIFEQTRDWKRAIPKSFHMQNPNLIQKLWIRLTGIFYYGIPVQFSKEVLHKLTKNLEEVDENEQFTGFLDFTMGRDKSYPIRLVMAHKDKNNLLYFLGKSLK